MSDAMTATETGGSPSSLYLDRIRTMRHVRNGKERVIEAILFVAAFCAVAVTVAIVAILLYEASTFFAHVSLVEFLTGTEWTPLFERASYGMLPLLVGTVVTSFIAFVVAGPLGFLIAMYLSEFAPPKLAEVLKPFLELLAAPAPQGYGSPWGIEERDPAVPNRSPD